MRRAVGIIILVLLVLSAALFWALQSGALTGRVIEEAESADNVSAYDPRGFIGICDDEQCVTVPTLIEKDGKQWQIGFYPEAYRDDGKPQLSYKSSDGQYLPLSFP